MKRQMLLRRMVMYFEAYQSRIPIPPTPRQIYQAMRAKIPFGHVLTQYFLASSRSRSPIPNAMGRNQCSTGTAAVCNTR
jgi:hypothetical protein